MFVYRIHVRVCCQQYEHLTPLFEGGPLKKLDFWLLFRVCHLWCCGNNFGGAVLTLKTSSSWRALCTWYTYFLFCSYLLFFLLLGLNTRQGATTRGRVCLLTVLGSVDHHGGRFRVAGISAVGKTKYAAWTLIMVDRRLRRSRDWDQAIKHHSLPIAVILFQWRTVF